MNIGFIGLGIMGSGMAHNLQRAGHRLTVYNRNRQRTEALAQAGVQVADSPAMASRGVDIVASCVTDGAALHDIAEGPEGILAGLQPGTLWIDCSTVAPSDARHFAAACAQMGASFLDAPVTGGDKGAREGILTVMVGGDAADFERAQPFFAAIGRRIEHTGPVGAGQATKLVQNLIGGLNLVAGMEGLLLASRLGLDLSKLLDLLGDTTAQSRALQLLGVRLQSGDFSPSFSAQNRQKDFRLALDLAHSVEQPMPLTAQASELMSLVLSRGLGAQDQTVLWPLLEALALGDGMPAAASLTWPRRV